MNVCVQGLRCDPSHPQYATNILVTAVPQVITGWLWHFSVQTITELFVVRAREGKIGKMSKFLIFD